MNDVLDALGIVGPPGALLTIAILLAARLAPIAWLAPYVAPAGSPAVVRTAVWLALVLALLGVASAEATPPASSAALVLAAARELAIGLCLAVISSVPLVVMEHVGRALDAWRPSRADRSGVYARLFAVLAAAAFVAIGGVRVVMRALGEGLVSLPLGAGTSDASSMALDTAQVVTVAIGFAVSLAAPGLVALVAAEIGIAIAVRAARLGRALDSALGVRGGLVLGASLLAVAAALPELPALTRWALTHMGG